MGWMVDMKKTREGQGKACDDLFDRMTCEG